MSEFETMTGDHPDARVVATCNDAIALLERVRRCDDGIEKVTNAEGFLHEVHGPAQMLTRTAMAMPVLTLAGVRAQAELLLAHYALKQNRSETPEIELPLLRNLMRLVEAS